MSQPNGLEQHCYVTLLHFICIAMAYCLSAGLPHAPGQHRRKRAANATATRKPRRRPRKKV